MKQKMMQFMQGRYGVDNLSRFILGIGAFFVVLSFFVRQGWVTSLALLMIVICYVRMLSRNIPKRYEENQKFIGYKNQILQLKTHHVYRCPNCKQKIRIPRGVGKVSIHCPKCNTDFVKKG